MVISVALLLEVFRKMISYPRCGLFNDLLFGVMGVEGGIRRTVHYIRCWTYYTLLFVYRILELLSCCRSSIVIYSLHSKRGYPVTGTQVHL